MHTHAHVDEPVVTTLAAGVDDEVRAEVEEVTCGRAQRPHRALQAGAGRRYRRACRDDRSVAAGSGRAPQGAAAAAARPL
eukprot:9544134-Lingulodinium_polyedra.AAC.1